MNILFVPLLCLFCYCWFGFLVFAFINNEFLVRFATHMVLFPQDKFLEMELLTHWVFVLLGLLMFIGQITFQMDCQVCSAM